MAGRAKASLSDFLKASASYTELKNLEQVVSFLPHYNCPNCSELVSVDYQENSTKRIYYVVRVKCSLCSYVGLGYVPYEATLSTGLSALISHVVKDLVSVDLIAQTERELEIAAKAEALLKSDLPSYILKSDLSF